MKQKNKNKKGPPQIDLINDLRQVYKLQSFSGFRKARTCGKERQSHWKYVPALCKKQTLGKHITKIHHRHRPELQPECEMMQNAPLV